MEKEGKLKRVPFDGRDQMKKLVDPVMAAREGDRRRADPGKINGIK